MRILLVLAHTGADTNTMHEFIYTYLHPSLELQQLAAITPDRHQVDIIDGRCKKIDFNWDGNIVGISCRTVSAKNAYIIADEFRRRGKTVVLGGYHPSSMPEEAKQHADAVVIGEAEISWPRLLEDFEKGEMKPFYQSEPVDPALIPPPKRMLKHAYLSAPIQATRGCPYGCVFCPVYEFQGCTYRMRPLDNVIDEIRHINSRRLFFVDNSLTVNPEYTKALFKKMKGLNKKFSCYGNINVLGKDEELLRLSREAGCDLWLVGLESINQETIERIGKTTNKVEEYASTIKKLHDYGMMIQGLFMFGFDNDTPDIFDKTLEAIYKWELDKAGFAILTPFPGTMLFNKFEEEGRILTEDWTKYNLKNVVFKPKNMSEEELFTGTRRLVKEFYSLPNSIRRCLMDRNLESHGFLNRIAGDFCSKKFYNIFGW